MMKEHDAMSETRFVVRAITSSDAAALDRFHRALSSDSVRLRWFTAHPRLTEAEIRRFTTVDHHSREALVATVGGEIVGIGRFDRLGGTTDAEVAFVVADDWHDHGVATELLGRLRERAREEGITRLIAETLAENGPMLAVFGHSGRPSERSYDHGVVHLVMPVDDAGPGSAGQSPEQAAGSAGTLHVSTEPPSGGDRSSE
jgi:GNAT superfamily N-acetyltransferase